MARDMRLEWRVSPAVAGLLSVVLHVGLLLVLADAGGRQDGVEDSDTPIIQLVMLESFKADRRDGLESGLLQPAVLEADFLEPPDVPTVRPPSLSLPDLEFAADTRSDERDETAVAEDASAIETIAHSDRAGASATEPLATLVMPPAEASALLERLEHLARKKLTTTSRTQVTWKQAGQRYNAELVLERAKDGTEADRIVAEISAENQGRRLMTRIMLKRLSFSQFTQIVDFWDPLVQLHDDEVVGRMHINSRINVLSDAQARPTLLGKVSTTAGSINLQSIGRTHASDVFRAGIEMRTQRITLSDRMDPFELTPRDAHARVHEFENDTRIRFFSDGSYWWRDSKSDTAQYHREPPGPPVYFIAARGAKFYVQGVVAGKVMVYSPQGIVLEGSLTYANDPRVVADSGDYLGLVCDKDIEVARPNVTGPGDVDIHAALFAKRRFVVTAIDHAHPATLRIYGSLAAGTLTASEPRYATKVEFDRRFGQRRPPGFPAMNRFAAEDWDRRWTEVPAQPTADGS